MYCAFCDSFKIECLQQSVELHVLNKLGNAARRTSIVIPKIVL